MRSSGWFCATAAGALLVLFGPASANAFPGLFGTGYLFELTVECGGPPKPGEHLGEYLVADQLPWRPPALPQMRVPETTVPLPPPEDWRLRRFGVWSGSWRGPPPQPRSSDLPPKPGMCLGEYVIADQLPPHHPVPEMKLPDMGFRVEIGYRFDSGSAVSTPVPDVIPPAIE
jgi:hypothetical protein